MHVPKLEAYSVGDMKDVILELMDSDVEVEKIPVRPGEKYHEILINEHEIRDTYENQDNDYVIYENQLAKDKTIIPKDLEKTTLTDQYSSDKVKTVSKDELKQILIEQKLVLK